MSYTVREYAKAINRSKEYVYQLIDEKKIEYRENKRDSLRDPKYFIDESQIRVAEENGWIGKPKESKAKNDLRSDTMRPYTMDDAFNMFAKLFSAYMEGSEPPKEEKPRTIKPFKVEDPEVLEVIARITKSSHCSKNEALLRMAHAYERQ